MAGVSPSQGLGDEGLGFRVGTRAQILAGLHRAGGAVTTKESLFSAFSTLSTQISPPHSAKDFSTRKP